MEQTVYETALGEVFPYVSAIEDQVDIFKSYPVRVRTQEKKFYYEVGASNISENTDIIINENESLREKANATSFEKLYLRPGDIILPYRSKKLHLGLYIESEYPLIPNPSLIIIRSQSIELSKYLLACLRQPFIKSYIEMNLISIQGKYHVLDFDKFRSLVVPVAEKKTNTALKNIEKYEFYTKRVALIQKHLEDLTRELQTEVIAGEFKGLDPAFSTHIDEHLGKLEELISSKKFTLHFSAIDLLRSRIDQYL